MTIAARSSSFRPLSLLVVGLGLLAPIAHAQETDLEVDVRSKIYEGMPQWNKEKTQAEGGHSRVYGIAAVKQIDSEFRLVKKVDETRVMNILMDTLDANGFREFKAGEKPGIVISASYGRGEVTNPYVRDTGEVTGALSVPSPNSWRDPSGLPSGPMSKYAGAPISVDNGAPTQTITGADPRQLFDEKGHGYEAKLQKAQYEKLFIRVTAFTYPPDAKTKPKMLWKTVMVVDDPDHRDLNAVAATMLAAGGPYFDKLTRNPEVETHQPLPTGRVKVGTPEVHEPFKSAPGK